MPAPEIEPAPQPSDPVRELLARAGLTAFPGRAVIAVAVACAVVLALVAWRWLSGGSVDIVAGGGEAVAAAGAAAGSSGGAGGSTRAAGAGAAGSAAATESVPPTVLVHVVGAVRRPGVYPLPADSRVNDAVEAAGGMLGNAAAYAVNLARPIGDGEQIVVPTRDEAPAPGAGAGAAGGAGAPAAGGAGAPSARVDINRAGVTELDALPGVGPSTAQKIVQDRQTNGRFAKPEDLMRVPGIGQKKFDALKDLISAG